MEYFEVVLLIAITSWIIKPNEKCNESKKKFSIIAAAILILFCSCRKFTVGYDGASYLMKFRQIANAGWVDILSKAPFGKIYQVEFGYAFLNKVISVTVSDYQWVIVICSTITVINFMIFIYKNSKRRNPNFYIYITKTGGCSFICSSSMVFLERRKKEEIYSFLHMCNDVSSIGNCVCVVDISFPLFSKKKNILAFDWRRSSCFSRLSFRN